MYFKVSPMKRVVRVRKKGKLIPQYVDPYEILQRAGKVVYEFKHPCELALVHPVIHVSNFTKCISDPESINPIEGHGVKCNLSYEEVQVQILDKKIKKLGIKKCFS